ncbi:MAG: VOC family protein [bacterium]|nr:VOC family protein [bacterium]
MHNITLITLGVENVQTSKHFYQNAFGWVIPDDANEDVVFFQLPGVVVGLYGRTNLADDIGIPSAGDGFRGATLAMNKRSEEEVDALIEHALTRGATLLKPAQKVFWGGYSGYIQDLDGHIIEIAYNPFWAFDEDGILKL